MARGTGSYGVFVKFRRSRLRLRRGIVHLDEALAVAEALRQSRFHDRDAIFVVKEPEGIVIDERSEGRNAPSSVPSTLRSAPPLSHAETAGWHQHLVRARSAMERALAARARFDQSFATVERAIRDGGALLPVSLRLSHARLVQVRALMGAAMASFTRSQAIVEVYSTREPPTNPETPAWRNQGRSCAPGVGTRGLGMKSV